MRLKEYRVGLDKGASEIKNDVAIGVQRVNNRTISSCHSPVLSNFATTYAIISHSNAVISGEKRFGLISVEPVVCPRAAKNLRCF